MGRGPFGGRRPFTAGDDGMFLGIDRPLVGAANALRIQISRESAIERASVMVPNPDHIMLREELDDVKRELANEKMRHDKLKELPPSERLRSVGVDPSELGPFEWFSPLERTGDRIFELQQEVEHLEERLEETPRRLTKEDARPSDVEEAITPDIEDALTGTGISKGPFVEDNGQSVIVTVSVVGLNERKQEEIRMAIEDEGYTVEDIEPFEI